MTCPGRVTCKRRPKHVARSDRFNTLVLFDSNVCIS